MIRCYSELITFQTFEERFRYLKLCGAVCEKTFGSARFLNQYFYQTGEWKEAKRIVTLRDDGLDLGADEHEICGCIYVHHMNPITEYDIVNRTKYLLDPEYLICCSFDTHQAITYGDENLLIKLPKERTKYDTCPWKLVKRGE